MFDPPNELAVKLVKFHYVNQANLKATPHWKRHNHMAGLQNSQELTVEYVE
jgi:hypothetical protein